MSSKLARTPSAREVDDEEEDYDDDFEDYSDEFDSEPDSPVKPRSPKRAGSSGRLPRKSSKTTEELDELKAALASENEAARGREQRTPESSPPPSAGRGAGSGAGAGSGSGGGSGGGSGSISGSRKPMRFEPPGAGASSKTVHLERRRTGGRELKDRGAIMIMSPSRPRGGNLGAKAKRVGELLQLVSLSEDSFELMNQAPIPHHDLYLNRLRSGALKQVASQHNDDARTIAIQTEAAETREAGMHFPDDIGFGDTAAAGSDAAALAAQSMRLARFLQRASAVCEALLEENLDMAAAAAAADGSGGGGGAAAESKLAESKAGEAADGRGAVGASMGGESITVRVDGASSCAALLRGRPLRDVAFSEAAQHEVLCAYGPQTGADVPADPDVAVFASGGLLCLWDVYNRDTPKAVLACPGLPVCCALSPDRAHVAVAGTEEGSIVLWDLRESNNMHRSDASVKLGVGSIRQPTYSTDALAEGGHSARVIRVVPLAASGGGGGGKGGGGGSSGGGGGGGGGGGDDEAGKASFQLASLDDRGGLAFWVTVEVAGADASYGVSEIDLGLGIGGRIKLVKAGRISTTTAAAEGDASDADAFGATTATGRRRSGSSAGSGSGSGSGGGEDTAATVRAAGVGPSACDVQVCPSEPSRFLVATVDGRIVHGDRFGGRVAVKAFEPPFEAEVTMATAGAGAGAGADGAESKDAGGGGGAAGAGAGAASETSSPCTSLHFSPFQPQYFLAGFGTGGVALYRSTASAPAVAWDAACAAPVVRVQWSATRPSVFYVLDAAGEFQAWDLLASDRAPVHRSRVPGCAVFAASLGTRVSTRRSSVALGSEGGDFTVHVCGPQLSQPREGELEAFQERLASIF